MLETRDLTAFYGDFQALFGITLTLNEGETLAIIGANGAGKSTFLKAIAGLLPRPASAVRLDGRDIGALPAFEIVKLGVALVPEGRRLFPVLRERRHAPSTALSGGQQQMVAIGRSLMSNPRILLCDELSLGLAPIVIRDIYAALADIKTRGTSVVLVEQ